MSFEADPSVLSVVFVLSVPSERSEFVVAPSLSDLDLLSDLLFRYQIVFILFFVFLIGSVCVVQDFFLEIIDKGKNHIRHKYRK